MPQLILIRGLPGSGKSTLARHLVTTNQMLNMFGSVNHYEADMYFIDKHGNYNFDRSKLHQAHKWCMEKTREGLANNHTVIVSNTFTTKKELKPYFEMASEFDIVPVVYLAQNQFKNIHGVPEETLRAMRDRFQYDISDMFVE